MGIYQSTDEHHEDGGDDVVCIHVAAMAALYLLCDAVLQQIQFIADTMSSGPQGSDCCVQLPAPGGCPDTV